MWSLFRRNARQAKRARRTLHSHRPRLEALEDRTLPSAGWAIATGGSGGVVGAPALSQPDPTTGDLYVTGYFQGTVTLGSTTLTTTVNNTSFVAKVDPNGNVLWAEQFGGLSGGAFTGIAVDTSGNVYLSGDFNGTQSFGGTTLTHVGSGATGYICKVDPNGNFLWAQRFSDQTSGGYGRAMAVDANDDPYLAWYANPPTGTVGFLTKYDPKGNTLWTQQLDSNATGVSPACVVLDTSGNAYVGGSGSQGNSVGFLAKYDPNGNPLWSQATPRQIWAEAIYQDPTGKNYLYTSVWPTTALPSDVQKWDAASGTVLWSEQLTSPSSVRPNAVAVDANGNVYLTGAFGGDANGDLYSLDFDPGPGNAILTSQAPGYSSDVFVVKLDPSGNFLSAYDFGGNSNSNSNGLVVDPSGNIYTAGSFGGTSNFDTGSQIVSLASTGSGNSLFVVKTTQDMGAIFGQVFNDLNDNGVFDPSSSNPETGIPNVTLYLDLNNSGSYVSGDPTATTDASGSYEFKHLAAGSYVIRQMTPSGWTQTAPSAGGANAVTLGTGQFVDTENFGDYTPSQTRSYASINVPLKLGTKSGAAITSTLTVNDAATIFDLNVSINVTTTSTSLAFSLTAPDGTSVSVQAGTTHVTGLNYHGTKGTWTLKMWNVAPAPKPSTLNSWSLQILEGSVTSPLTSSPNLVSAGGSLTPSTTMAPVGTMSGTSSDSSSSPATLPLASPSPTGSDSTLRTDSVLSSLAPAATAGGIASNGSGWSAFGASVLGTLEHDLSQWEDAMTKEMASLIQTVDQLFVELSADLRVSESTVAPLA